MGSLREEMKNYWAYPLIPGEFGLEIEAETAGPDDYPEGFIKEKYNESEDRMDPVCSALEPEWIVKYDSSLRNYGLEYVLKKPMSYVGTLAALDKFADETLGIPFLQNSPSTSVHTHINMTNETALTMGNFLTQYLLYENILVEFSGEIRRSNLFALPARVAEATARNIAIMFQKYEKGDQYCVSWDPEQVKYGALNLGCLKSLGSLEVRSFRGTTDVQLIKTWVSVLYRMLKYARTEGLTPRDILRSYRDHDLELFYNIFGSYTDVLKQNIPHDEFVRLIDKNLWYAKEVADSVKDWHSISETFSRKSKPEKKSPTKKTPIDILLSDFVVPNPMWAINQPVTTEPYEQPQPDLPNSFWDETPTWVDEMESES